MTAIYSSVEINDSASCPLKTFLKNIKKLDFLDYFNMTKVHWLIRQMGCSEAWNVFYAALLTEAIVVTVYLKLD